MLCDACNRVRFPPSSPTRSVTAATGVTATSEISPPAVAPSDSSASNGGNDTNGNPDGGSQGGDCCTAECEYAGKRDGRMTMVRCTLCMREFHKRCLSDHMDYVTYTCSKCRIMPALITELVTSVDKLTKSVAQLTTTNTSLANQLRTTRAKCEELATANTALSTTVADLSAKIASQNWQQFRAAAKPTTRRSVVIGSSILRDLDQDKLDNTDVISISGGKVPDIHRKLAELPKDTYNRVTLMVGGNDCDNPGSDVSPQAVTDIITDYRALITDAKSRAPEVFVGTVCPRLKGPDVDARIDSLNAGLNVLCGEEGCTLINNDESFKLSNGSANDGYILKDKVHLTYSGTNRLAKNLDLKPKTGNEGDVCKRSKGSPKNPGKINNHAKPAMAQGRQGRPGTNMSSAAGRHQDGRRRPPHQGVRSHDNRRADSSGDDYAGFSVPTSNRFDVLSDRDDHEVRCWYCYEPGHTHVKCRHQDYVRCRTCEQYGHKSKHHQ